MTSCEVCGAPLEAGATECKYCGAAVEVHSDISAAIKSLQESTQQQQEMLDEMREDLGYENLSYDNVESEKSAGTDYEYEELGRDTSKDFGYKTFDEEDDRYDTRPVKNKLIAGLLAIFLGGFGIQFFYLGNYALGIVCLLFCWTRIPAFIGLIMGIMILVSSEESFEDKYGVRNG